MTAEPSTTSAHGPAPIGMQVRVPKMAELVASHLRRQIVRGELAEGAALPTEAALMQQFQVSRPTLREAFRVLESESLITVRRGARGGARVQLPNADVAARYAGLILEHRGTTVADVYEARIVVEPPAIGLLARRRTAAGLTQLRAALDEHDAVSDHPGQSMRAHTAFHTLLIDLTGNQTLRVLMGIVDQIISSAVWPRVEADTESTVRTSASRKGLKVHHRVVDLIEARDDVEAEKLWRKHLTEARDYLLQGEAKSVLDMLG
jgi:GntR family transcriptional regulator, transcriptional repressor for pyruvate dehydrogenase complex